MSENESSVADSKHKKNKKKDFTLNNRKLSKKNIIMNQTVRRDENHEKRADIFKQVDKTFERMKIVAIELKSAFRDLTDLKMNDVVLNDETK